MSLKSMWSHSLTCLQAHVLFLDPSDLPHFPDMRHNPSLPFTLSSLVPHRCTCHQWLTHLGMPLLLPGWSTLCWRSWPSLVNTCQSSSKTIWLEPSLDTPTCTRTPYKRCMRLWLLIFRKMPWIKVCRSKSTCREFVRSGSRGISPGLRAWQIRKVKEEGAGVHLLIFFQFLLGVSESMVTCSSTPNLLRTDKPSPDRTSFKFWKTFWSASELRSPPRNTF